MRTKKTVLRFFNYMYCDDFAKYLSDMAAKGWHFIEWGVGLKFEKGEPEQAIYTVEVLTNKSENNMRPKPNAQTFAKYYESLGWKFIDSKQKYYIFKKIDENALELFSPKERVSNAFKGVLSVSAIVLFLIYGIFAFLQWKQLFFSFEETIFSGSFLFEFLLWNILFLEQLSVFVQAFWNRRKLIKKIRFGKKVYLGIRENKNFHLNWHNICISILILLLMYYFFLTKHMELIIINFVIVGCTLGFAILIKKIVAPIIHSTNTVFN